MAVYESHIERVFGGCPNCGKFLLVAIGKTNFYRLVDETFGSNRRVQEATRVKREHITQMQYCGREEEVGKFAKSAETVAEAMGVSVDYMLAPDPNSSTVKCLHCGFEAPYFMLDALRED